MLYRAAVRPSASPHRPLAREFTRRRRRRWDVSSSIPPAARARAFSRPLRGCRCSPLTSRAAFTPCAGQPLRAMDRRRWPRRRWRRGLWNRMNPSFRTPRPPGRTSALSRATRGRTRQRRSRPCARPPRSNREVDGPDTHARPTPGACEYCPSATAALAGCLPLQLAAADADWVSGVTVMTRGGSGVDGRQFVGPNESSVGRGPSPRQPRLPVRQGRAGWSLACHLRPGARAGCCR